MSNEQTETVYANVEEATRALTSDADYSRPIGQPTPGGRYDEMLPANPLPKEDFGEQTFEGKEGIKRAAEEVVARRIPTRDELQAAAPVEVSYRAGIDGPIKPAHEVVGASQAAHDLTTFRQTLQEQEQSAADTTENLGIDQQAQPQATQPQPTPEQPQAADDPVAKALSDPRVLSAVQDYVGQAQAQANAQAQYYAQAVAQNAQVAMAAVLNAYPELQGLSDPSQLQTAIQVVAKQNPERAQSMVRHLEGTRALFAEQQRVQAARQQAYAQAAQQQWNQYSKAQDDAFDKFVTANNVSAEEQRQIREEALAALRESGMTDQQIEHHWNHGELRSFHAQKLMFESAKFRLAQKAEAEAKKSISHKRDRTPPTVQHPGAGSAEIASREDYGLRALSEKVSLGHRALAPFLGIPSSTSCPHAASPGLVDTILVRHVSGGVSRIGLKSYAEGREKWQGTSQHVIWLDEEPDAFIYSEALTRIGTTDSIIFMTFTPLLGMSEVVRRFLQQKSEDRHVTVMTLNEAEHISEEKRKQIVAGYPLHEVEARTKGTPILGSGRVFPIAEERLAIEHRSFPGHWPRIGAMDFGYEHHFAAVELVWDRDTDTVYVARCYRVNHSTPIEHAAALRSWAAISAGPGRETASEKPWRAPVLHLRSNIKLRG